MGERKIERKILEIYKNRMINYSGRNQTLCRNKLYSSKAFDIVKLDEIVENKSKEILLSLIKDNNKEHKLLGRSEDLKLNKLEIEKIQKEFADLLDKSIIKKEFTTEERKKLKLNEDEILRKRAFELLNNNKLDEKKALYHNFSKNLDKLFNEIDAKERETGLYELYIGYPFIEGKLLDGKPVRAPLFLFPSSISKRNGEWFYKNLNDEKIFINKVFLMAYKDSYEKSIDHIEEEYEEVGEFFKNDEKIKNISDFLKKIQNWGIENDITIKNESFSNTFEKMKDYKVENYKIYNDGDLFLQNNFILGQYSVGSNGIYKDIEKMMVEDDLPKSVTSLLNFDTETVDGFNKEMSNEIINIDEKDNYFVTELDYSQEVAVKMAETLDNLVIYGPPGTGKSQVIANIVSDYLAKGKKVLVVSEKRTALDVVYKRLEKVGLHSKLAFAHDSKKDRQIIMEKIIDNYEKASKEGSLGSSNINKKSNEIQEKIELLDKLAKELHKQRDVGVSLYKLYTHSKLDNDILDEVKSNFNKYDNFNYHTLKEFIDKLSEIKDYTKYDNKKSHIYHRKDFSIISSIQKREILEILKRLDGKIKINTHLKHIKQLESQIENIDILKIWEKNNSEYIDLYKNIEEIYQNLENYEKAFFLSFKKFKLKKVLKNIFPAGKIEDNKGMIDKILNEKKLNEKLNIEVCNVEIDIVERAKLLITTLMVEEKEIIEKKIKEILDMRENIDEVSKYFSNDFIDKLLIDTEEIELDDLIKIIKQEFNEIQNYDMKKKNIENKEIPLFKHFVENNHLEYIKKLENTYYFKWIENIEKEISDILMIIDEYDLLKSKTFNLIQEKKKYVPAQIEKIINDNIIKSFEYNRVGNEVSYRNLISEAGKKRKKQPLRKYIEMFKDQGLFNLIPCWLLTPEIASEILPYEKEFFDIVIFDEASQMFVEKSLPTIYRSKKVVIAGDDKQLKPSAIGTKRNENQDDEAETDEYIDDTAYEVESLLDLAKERYKGTLLSYHYRSKYPELINFSNYAFYHGRLITAPTKENLKRPPIEVLKVENGIWENQSNIAETERVYKLVKKLLLDRKNNESIGIVTFNGKQQDMIKSYLDNICESDIEFRELYEKEKIRYDGTEDQSLFVKNIENVQGDERDIIIFSTAYAKDVKTGRVASRFGTLSQPGGENRLNVAISRAKLKIYIVTSIEPEELNVEGTKNDGPKLLKKYLQYARCISDNNKENATKILESLSRIKESEYIIEDIFDSPFEEEVCEKLRAHGYEVHTQVGDSGYRIDLSIYDKVTSDYILGIECDGATYHSSPSARERDIYRQKFLELKGWNIHRIWSRNWWENPNKEIEKIVRVVENIKS